MTMKKSRCRCCNTEVIKEIDGTYCCPVCGHSTNNMIKITPVTDQLGTTHANLYQVSAMHYVSKGLVEHVSSEILDTVAKDLEMQIAQILAEYLLDHIRYQVISDSEYGAIKLCGSIVMKLDEPNSHADNDLFAMLEAWKTMHSVMSKPWAEGEV